MPCLTRSTAVQVLLSTLEHLDFIFKERPWFLKTCVAFYLKIYFYLLREKFGSHVVNWVKMSIHQNSGKGIIILCLTQAQAA